MKTLYSLAVAALILSACNSEEPKKASSGEPEETDTTAVDSNLVDTLSISDDSLEAQGYDVNEEANMEENIEKKYGIQWDFCTCVIKNDSVTKAVETAGDEDFDKILARMEEIDKHCKKMLTAPNTTPEERMKHKRKVNKCLRQVR